MAHSLAQLEQTNWRARMKQNAQDSWNQENDYCQASIFKTYSFSNISFFSIPDLVFDNRKYDCQWFLHIYLQKRLCLFSLYSQIQHPGKKLRFGPSWSEAHTCTLQLWLRDVHYDLVQKPNL